MARTQARSGKGHQLLVGDGNGNGSASSSYAAISEGHSTGLKFAVDALEATNTDSDNGAKEFISGPFDGGQVQWAGNLLNDNVQAQLLSDMQAGTLRNFKVTIPSANPKSYSFLAVIVGFDVAADYKAVLPLSLTLRVSGSITVS
jgi:hypothetical protein